jgi:hypothetical protein
LTTLICTGKEYGGMPMQTKKLKDFEIGEPQAEEAGD